MVVFANAKLAEMALQKLLTMGFSQERINQVSVHEVMHQIALTIQDASRPWPSLGSEVGAVRH